MVPPSFYEDAVDRAKSYTLRRKKQLKSAASECLGWGQDGVVFETTTDSATEIPTDTVIKSLRYEPLYRKERNAYLRLEAYGVTDVLGSAVPQLIDYDDELWVVEMGVVSPPCVLDFASAYVDDIAPFTLAELDERLNLSRDMFGDDWAKAIMIILELRKHGIYLFDVRPTNIIFRQ